MLRRGDACRSRAEVAGFAGEPAALFSHRLPGSKDCESFNGKLRDEYLNGEIF
jgi:hypothetical protein